MVFPLQREWVEALTEQQKAELFTEVCGYLENGGDYLDDFNSSTRWNQQTVMKYMKNQFWKDFVHLATTDIQNGGDKKRLFQFVVLPQCRHLLPQAEDKPHMEETGPITRYSGHLVTCLVVPNFWSLRIPEAWKKEWFLSFYELEEEWIAGGFSGVMVDS